MMNHTEQLVPLNFRAALHSDLPAIVAMLADDELGAQREQYTAPLPDGYHHAFAAIEADPNNELIVTTLGTTIIGVLQITFIPYLTYQGGWRALIEGVRIAKEHRSHGIGRQMFQWAITRAHERNCHMVQLTTDKARPNALRFYEQLGFVASHHGLKLRLR